MFFSINTATDICSVSLFCNDKFKTLSKNRTRDHSQYLSVYTKELIKGIENKIEYIALSIGPGSFTGLKIGSSFSKGDAMAVAESVKAASDIYAPVSGKIVSVNTKLEESPELINESPYDFGWMVTIEPTGELEDLLDSDSYRELIA